MDQTESLSGSVFEEDPAPNATSSPSPTGGPPNMDEQAREALPGTSHQEAALLVPASQGPSGATATGPKVNVLLRRRLERLRRDLTATLEYECEEEEDPAVVLAELVDAHVEAAADLMPKHDRLLAKMRAIMGAVAAAETAIEDHLDFAKSRTGADQEATLNLANAAVERWFTKHLPALQAIEDALPDVWYIPGKDDPALRYIDQKRHDMDAVALDVKRQRREAGLTSTNADAAPALAGALQLQAPRKTARMVDVGPFVTKFVGDGQAKEAMQKYRTWRREWAGCRRHLETRCDDCDHEVLLLKLRTTLEGQAADLVAAIPANAPNGVQDALDTLDERYGDEVAVTAAYLEEVRTAPTGTAKEQVKAVKDGLSQLATMRKAIVDEDLDILEFVVLSSMANSLPQAAQNSWRAKKIDLKEAHRAANKALPADQKTPWKQSAALNSASFLAWFEAYSASHQDEDASAEASNFLAGAVKSTHQPSKGKCALHPGEAHATADCRLAMKVDSEKWMDACKAAQICSRCLEDFDRGHWKTCKASCKRCGLPHHVVRCGKDKTRPRPEQSSSSSSSSAKRPKLEDEVRELVKALRRPQPAPVATSAPLPAAKATKRPHQQPQKGKNDRKDKKKKDGQK